jgi:uncharacterized protein (TIGR02391 family)
VAKISESSSSLAAAFPKLSAVADLTTSRLFDRNLVWETQAAINAEIKKALTPLDLPVYPRSLAMPSIRLRPKSLVPVPEAFWSSIDAEVTAVSRELFDDGHFAQAVFEAAKLYDNEVKQRSMSCGGRELSGIALMSEAFSVKRPFINVADCSRTTGQDIQQGMMHLSMGVMFRIRNPLGHEHITMQLDEAKDWIVVISRLMKDLKQAPLW